MSWSWCLEMKGPWASMTSTESMCREGEGFQVGKGTQKRDGHVEAQPIIKKCSDLGRRVN